MRFSVAFGLLGLLEVATALRYGNTPPGKLRQDAAHAKAKRSLAKREDTDPTLLYPAYNISVPVDYFPDSPRYEPHSNASFDLRYWFDASNYKPGGPVFVLLGGETDGAGRLPYLQKGIVAQVAQATNGIGVIMEHRYYGTSFPVPDLSVENMRFLSTEQALADVDYLARNVQFEGIDADMTAPNTPWIIYGGSYAGAQAAFLRVVYPDTFWGTISSSGVTAAIYDYWQYFEPIRQFAPLDVVKYTQLMVDVVDKIFMSNDTAKAKELKDAFGLGGITDNRDFANVLTGGIYGWQSTNWDPEVNAPDFWEYQNNMTTTLNNNDTESKRSTVQDLLTAAGYEPETGTENVLLNAINYFGVSSVSAWNESGETQDQYYSLLNASSYDVTDLELYDYRSWPYQVCTEWGYIQTGDTPKDIMPLVSRLIDLEYGTVSCRLGFNMTTPPDTDQVNKYGNFSIEYPRLAIIGGNADPWRPATPLADEAPERNSTTEEPVLLISHAVHHWEENGIFPNETTPILPPNQIVYAQEFLVNFVMAWMQEWEDEKAQHEL